MIRQQQATIQNLQNQNAANNPNASTAVDDSTPTSERSMSLNHGSLAQATATQHTPGVAPRSRSPFVAQTLSRNSSYRSGRSSHEASPNLHPAVAHNLPGDGNEIMLGGAAIRDESAFYQAETQNLTRENQMLKLRIRELGKIVRALESLEWKLITKYAERQLSDMGSPHSNPHSPGVASNLQRPPLSSSDNDGAPSATTDQ